MPENNVTGAELTTAGDFRISTGTGVNYFLKANIFTNKNSKQPYCQHK